MYKASYSATRKKIIISLLAVVCLGVLAYLGWNWYDERRTQTNAPEVTETPEPIEEPVTMEEYTSRDPALAFTYPSDWKVRVDEEENTVLVESPALSIQTAEGAPVDGYFRIFFRQGAREQDQAYIGRGIAALPSEALTYSDPALNQREETMVSFFGLDSSDNFAYFFVAGNFNLEPGQSLGGNYGADDDTYIIGGGYSSAVLTDDLAMHPVSLDYYDQPEEYQEALDIIRSIRIGRF